MVQNGIEGQAEILIGQDQLRERVRELEDTAYRLMNLYGKPKSPSSTVVRGVCLEGDSHPRCGAKRRFLFEEMSPQQLAFIEPVIQDRELRNELVNIHPDRGLEIRRKGAYLLGLDTEGRQIGPGLGYSLGQGQGDFPDPAPGRITHTNARRSRYR